MKYINIFIIACIFLSAITSCSINREITFHGTPGTNLYMPGTNEGLKKIATIDNNGTAKVKFTRKKGIHYLLVYDNDSKKYYPIGMDHFYRERTIEQIILYSSFIPGPNIIGFPVVLGNDKYYFSDQFDKNYRYCQEQNIISTFPNAPYANTGERREVQGESKAANSILSKWSTSSSSSKLLRNDNAKKLQGAYEGNGKLMQGNKVIESYKNMTIKMSYVDKNTLSVSIFMDGNEEVVSACDYTIKSKGNESYLLTSENDKNATIKVDGKNVTYNNPNINIDGEIYKLLITVK